MASCSAGNPPIGSNRPDAATQEKDPESLLNFVRKLLAFRKTCPAAGSAGDFRVLYAEAETCPVVYGRNTQEESVVVAVNPSGKAVTASFAFEDAQNCETVFSSPGVGLFASSGATRLDMPPVSFAVYRRPTPQKVAFGPV